EIGLRQDFNYTYFNDTHLGIAGQIALKTETVKTLELIIAGLRQELGWGQVNAASSNAIYEIECRKSVIDAEEKLTPYASRSTDKSGDISDLPSDQGSDMTDLDECDKSLVDNHPESTSYQIRRLNLKRELESELEEVVREIDYREDQRKSDIAEEERLGEQGTSGSSKSKNHYDMVMKDLANKKANLNTRLRALEHGDIEDEGHLDAIRSPFYMGLEDGEQRQSPGGVLRKRRGGLLIITPPRPFRDCPETK
ncbi:MAG: hypothetical protein Q9187_008287, partial [Circinaria calcarea]